MKKITLFSALLLAATLSTTAQGLLNGLQACYPLDCDNAVNMAATGSALDGTIFNLTCTTDRNGTPASAYAFGGTTTSYIKLKNDVRIKPDTISFSAWVKFNNSNNRQYIVFAKNSCSSYFEGYDLHAEPTGGGFLKLQLVKSGGACSPSTEQVLNGITSINYGNWHHVGFYMGNDSLKLYLDGALESSALSTVNFNYSTTDSVYLGGTHVSYYNWPFDGTMDNVRFYNRKLDNGEFATLHTLDPGCSQPALLSLLNGLEGCYPLNCDAVNYAPTAAVLPSLDGNPVNVTCTTDRNGNLNSAFSFAGTTSSYIELPNDSRLKPSGAAPSGISFSCWSKINTLNTDQYIVFAKNGCTSWFEGYTLMASDDGSGNVLYKIVKASSGCFGTYAVLTTPVSYAPNAWHHVVFFMDDNVMKLYVDNTGPYTLSSSIALNYGSTNVYLGGTNASYFNRPFDGDMDNVRFYSRELSAQEVGILYNHDPDCSQSWCANPACTSYLPRQAAAVGLGTNKANNKAVELYPNPSAGKLFIRNGQDKSLLIYDISGKAVQHTVVAADETTSEVTLTNKAEGLYFVKILDTKGNIIQTSKIVITH